MEMEAKIQEILKAKPVITVSDIPKRNEIKKHIKTISDWYGGDDAEFLESYTASVLDEWKHDLPKAVDCFRDLIKHMERMKGYGVQTGQPTGSGILPKK